MQQALVTIVIPIHLEEPSELEKISLAQTLAVLHRYPITFMAPTTLNTAWYEDYCRGKATIHIQRFEWQGYQAYGELMISDVFFRAFLAYQYILICHLDAFVFRDELEKWCQQGYDFMGAVIYNPHWQLLDSRLRRSIGLKLPEYFGNGGFALKKVATFYQITSRFRWLINFYLWVRRIRKQGLLDDLLTTQYFPKLRPSFSIPPQRIAQDFGAAYEVWDESKLPFTNQDIKALPFGIHGWIKYHPDFWRPVFRQYGYQI